MMGLEYSQLVHSGLEMAIQLLREKMADVKAAIIVPLMHKKIVQDLRVKSMPDSIPSSFQTGLSINILFDTGR